MQACLGQGDPLAGESKMAERTQSGLLRQWAVLCGVARRLTGRRQGLKALGEAGGGHSSK